MPLKFNHTEFNDLSSRAQFAFRRIGSKDDVLEYYIQNGHFLKIKGTGIKTNLELCSLCDFLLGNPTNGISQENSENSNLVPVNILECLDLYNIKKNGLSQRLLNILTELETKNQFDDNREKQIQFLVDHLFSNFEILRIDGCGKKAATEFTKFTQEIREIAKAEKVETGGEYNNDLASEIYRKLAYGIPKKTIEKYVDLENDSYQLVPLLASYTLKQLQPGTKKEILLNYFYSVNSKSQEELANQIGCVRERVRQVEANFKLKWLPDIITSFREALKGIAYDLQANTSAFIRVDRQSKNATDVDDKFTPNHKFVLYATSYYFENSHFSVTNFVNTQTDDFKSFQTNEDHFFIEYKLAQSIQIEKFIKWIDSEIFNFFSCDFEFNLNVLIRRFYQEFDIFIEPPHLTHLESLVQNYMRQDWSIYNSTIKKLKRKQVKDEIVELISSFFSENPAPQKTQHILTYLQRNQIEINKVNLLQILNQYPSRFSRLGNGFWGQKENDHTVHGSLRDIVGRKLNSIDIPLHISELLSYIDSLRPISEQSLITNLKSAEEGNFLFLNCGYIGLKSKTYEDSWHKLPKVTGSIIRAATLNFSSLEARISFLTSKYKIPYIHASFVLSKKNPMNSQ